MLHQKHSASTIPLLSAQSPGQLCFNHLAFCFVGAFYASATYLWFTGGHPNYHQTSG